MIVDMLKLRPGELTVVPGTRCGIRYDGPGEVTVYRLAGGWWDLSPLQSPGRVLLWCYVVDHPELPPWPIMPAPIGR